MIETTIGQLLVNDALPEEMRDYSRVMTKGTIRSLLEQIAKEQPERYREVSHALNQVGLRAAQDQGGFSFGARHLKSSESTKKLRERLQQQINQILDDDRLSDKEREERITLLVGREMEPQMKAVLQEALEAKNPLALQVQSGSRGKPMNLASLLASDMLYADQRDEFLPVLGRINYWQELVIGHYWNRKTAQWRAMRSQIETIQDLVASMRSTRRRNS